MARIILVRHGETEWNKQEVFRGTIDVELNSTGLKQAQAVGEGLKNQKINAVYSSPLSRALQTAQIIVDCLRPNSCEFGYLRVNVEMGFTDLNYGEWQGVSHDDAKMQYPELYTQWHEQPHRVCFPSGECLDGVRARAMKAIKRILSEHANDTVVIVAHRVVNKAILCAVLGIDTSHFWRIRQDTCCINIFEDSPHGYVIFHLNDVCHLKNLGEGIVETDF